MDAIIKHLKEEKTKKKNNEKIKGYFIEKKNLKRNIIFYYFVFTIKNHCISRNIIFCYLEKIL